MVGGHPKFVFLGLVIQKIQPILQTECRLTPKLPASIGFLPCSFMASYIAVHNLLEELLCRDFQGRTFGGFHQGSSAQIMYMILNCHSKFPNTTQRSFEVSCTCD